MLGSLEKETTALETFWDKETDVSFQVAHCFPFDSDF